mmetsp:Transcript_28200/g.32228  ORF Transcript_28200/g.32228 Transcript_28200/m.32228 type:complete len:97 (-) Transcript_28200:613-903(-)
MLCEFLVKECHDEMVVDLVIFILHLRLTFLINYPASKRQKLRRFYHLVVMRKRMNCERGEKSPTIPFLTLATNRNEFKEISQDNFEFDLSIRNCTI